jgi:hypothetical protein
MPVHMSYNVTALDRDDRRAPYDAAIRSVEQAERLVPGCNG